MKESTSRSRPAAQSRALVLVADDDEDVLALTCICLERAGYRTARALDGEEALRLAREQLPNLAPRACVICTGDRPFGPPLAGMAGSKPGLELVAALLPAAMRTDGSFHFRQSLSSSSVALSS